MPPEKGTTMHAMNRRDACRVIAASPMLAAPLTACAGGIPRPRLTERTSPMPGREFRGVWVATVDNIDWPSTPGLPASQQQREIDRILDAAADLELNAIFLQVRPTCDALYRSTIEPWSAFLTGRQGQSPTPEYDPLDRWVRGAHARGLDLHAWVNPFRARHPKSVGPDAINHVSKIHPGIVRNYRGHLWLDPGHPVSRELALRVVGDLLNRYDIDGVHMDDYFYPYPDPKVPFPDDTTYAEYRKTGGSLAKDDWRRENIDRFVAAVNALVHRDNPGRLFTVSPFGIWRPQHPPGVVGFDAYAGLYADARRWMREGWCDAMMPQLYWEIGSKGQPFEPLLNWWADQNTRGRHLWPGLYLTRILKAGEEGTSWEASEIAAQVDLLGRSKRATGYALFSMIGLLDNRRGVTDRLRAGSLASPALVPESPWLDAPRPLPPIAIAERSGSSIKVKITPGAGAPARRYVISPDSGDKPGWVLPAGEGSVETTLLPATPLPAGSILQITPIGPNGVTGLPGQALV